ncbi:hypothetical protein C1H46_019137 [Malus baccata]|uniref:SET domain-containing protein n=1 Tax=Malus baccata TaxID=106549 RepID=A0A540M984_MALBA|nr:hypothetical protein C1H46_019137 [Malus baccata]
MSLLIALVHVLSIETVSLSSLGSGLSCSGKVTKALVDEFDDFLPWLKRKVGADISSALSIGKSAYGTSLFASKSITAGDCVLKVPYSLQLASDNLVPELKDLLSDEVGDAAKLAAVVLFEQRMGNDSGWAPYIRRLPCPEEMHCTVMLLDGQFGQRGLDTNETRI